MSLETLKCETYRNNRIYMPNGDRVLPGHNNRVELSSDPNFMPPIRARPGEPTENCIICMEDIPISHMIKLECQHSFCRICVKDQLLAALGNVTDSIPLKCPNSATGCTHIITHDSPHVKRLLSKRDYEKFEKYTLLKMHIPAGSLRHCPNQKCQMPYEFDPPQPLPKEAPKREFLFYLQLRCFSCNTNICTFCDDIWHPAMSCYEYQKKLKENPDESTMNYIGKYCKKCPRCNMVVQKQQSPEQELYERTTGLSAGTYDCNHMTCTTCKTDFCWTCLGLYNTRVYYHPECPNVDCVIRFMGMYPRIQHLPLGRISRIKLIVYEDDELKIVKGERLYNTLNSAALLETIPKEITSNIVFLHCTRSG